MRRTVRRAPDRGVLRLVTRPFGPRLLIGTGTSKDLDETRRAVAASRAECVTVAIRRASIGQDP